MSLPRVNVDDLQAFLAIAEAENVTAASARLHLSQPAVTRALARLEQQFGAQLFDRPGHRVQLNAFGRALVVHAGRIVAQLGAAQAEIDGLLDPHAGPVRLGFLPSLGAWLVPELIRSFRALEPDIGFVLRQGTPEAITRMLQEGEVDLLLTSPPPQLEERASWKLLVDERLELAVPPGHRLAARRRVGLATVAGEQFVTLDREWELRQITDRLCEQAGFYPQIAFESGELATVRALVAAGLGVAIVPASRQPPGPGSPPTVAITGAGASRPLGLAWMTRRQLPGSTEAFRSWLAKSGPVLIRME